MTQENSKTATLAKIREMFDAGDLYFNPNAPEGPELGAAFWANARVVHPPRPKSVHLKLDPEVFEYFVGMTKGKGHLTRMQAVFKAYRVAHKALVPPGK